MSPEGSVGWSRLGWIITVRRVGEDWIVFGGRGGGLQQRNIIEIGEEKRKT